MPGVYLKSVEQLRTVEWSRSFLWDIKFTPGSSFTKETDGVDLNVWFPATNVEENLWTLDTHPFNGGNSTYEIPKSTTLFTLKVTWVDDVKLSVNKFLRKWVNTEILGVPGTTACLEKCVKLVELSKLDNKGNVVDFSKYWVYPKGVGMYSGNSDSNNIPGDTDFIIAGTAK